MNLFSMNFVPEFAELLTTALIHFAWQGAVLALVLFATVKLLDVRAARTRYLLSVGTLLMMAVAPVVTVMWHQRGGSQARASFAATAGRSNPLTAEDAANAMSATAGVVVESPERSAAGWNSAIEVYVLIVWLAGVFLLSARLAIGFGATLWIRVNAQPLSEEFERRARVLGERLGVDARKRVFACMRVGQAVAVGFIRPVVLIPASWLTELAPQTVEAIIAHELAHIRRWDLWVNLLQRIVETVLFYHPAVWWLSGRIRLEREMCCDEIAAECFDRVSYARSLETVARIGHGNLIMAAAIAGGKRMNLLNRVRYLLGLAPSDAAGNWWAVGFVALILPLAAAVAFALSTAARPSLATADHDPADHDPAEPTAVGKIVVVKPRRKAVTVTQRYVGHIQSERHINVRAPQTGYLKAIAIKEGQAVKTGDLVFEIVPVLHEANFQVAEAEKNLAQLELARTKKLAEDKVVSDYEVKLFEAKAAKAGAQADAAAAELNFTKIRAPFDGIIDHLQERGSMVKQGEILATLSDNSNVRVYFNVPETHYLEQMTDPGRRDEEPQVELILANGKKFGQPGKLQAMRGDFNSETGTISFRADFPNPQHLLRHGQAGTVLISRVVNDAVVVPQRATFELLGGRYVYVVDERNVARRREIFVENEVEDLFVIKKGVEVDEKIILEGVRQVHDGEKVEYEDRGQNNE